MAKQAHVKGRVDSVLIEKTIGALFDEVSDSQADNLALISRHQNIRLTYRQMRKRVDALACGLARLGIQKGDRVGIWAPNCEEWALTQFATAKLGAILVNVNPAYRLNEVEYALKKVGCRALITASTFKSSDYIAMMNSLLPELTSDMASLPGARLPELAHVIRLGTDTSSGFLNFEDLLTEPSPKELSTLQATCAALDPNDPINIQFTSGTTGAPKAATLTHRNILNNGFFVGEVLGLEAGDSICIPVPLYHCFGMVMGNLGLLTHGGTMLYPSDGFDPVSTLQAITEEGCAALYAVPTMFIAMLEELPKGDYDLSSLRTGIMAGSPCPIEVMKQVMTDMGCPEVTIAYGMTETSPVSFQTNRDDPIERRVSTVGRIQPHCEVKIIDPSGKTLERGEMGELCTKGYLVMQGYWGDPAQTQAAIDDEGFMHTGDLAVIDDDGYCTITGRSKDMVIRGGENIYPREVEEFLYQHPKIKDVQVVGLPSDTYGEELCACVIANDPTATADEIRAFCKGQIAHYKIPRHVEFVSEFPLTVTGKIQKYLMREAMIKKLDLGDATPK